MQKIKFDFEATKERIYAPNSNVPIGAPVDRNGNIANDGNAYGIVLCKETENEKYWVRYNLVVMVAGYCDIIDAQAIWGDEYSAEAMAAMSGIEFCYDHKIPSGSDPAIANAKATGGFGWTEQGEQTTIAWDGNTEDRDVIAESYYKITDNAPQISTNFEKLVFNGVEYEITEDNIKEETDHLIFIGTDESDYVLIADDDVDLGGMEIAKGVYFAKTSNGYTSSLTYGTPETVHTIDPKYLGGGGAMVVINATESDGAITVDKTYADIVSNVLNTPHFISYSGTLLELYGVGETSVTFGVIKLLEIQGESAILLTTKIVINSDDTATLTNQPFMVNVVPLG